MKVARSIPGIRKQVADAVKEGRGVGLVPTMGALHAGHLSLVDRARAECGFVVVSIFVNPTQFAPGEDFDTYPCTPEADLAACERHGADAVFMPAATEMYPPEARTTVSVSGLARTLCGRSRPTHFAGVCTIVAKLFNAVGPDRAYFGRKDYQQYVIIKRMAADLDFPVEVVGCPTVREADGLAMSSRNANLTDEQRAQAPALYRSLQQAEDRIRESQPPAGEVLEAIRNRLAENAPLGAVDYVQIVDPETLEEVEATDRPVVIALAVRFGGARLIDNIFVDDTPGRDVQ